MAKGSDLGSGTCPVDACNEKAFRFGFCKPHHEQFKFGLITRKGAPAADYEKKLEHFKAFQAKKGGSSVA